MNKRIKKHLPCGLYDFKGLERWLDLYADILVCLLYTSRCV